MKKRLMRLFTLAVLPVLLLIIFNAASYGQCTSSVSVNINDTGPNISVAPGTILKMQFIYKVSNPEGCPRCIDQVMVGLNDQYLGCLFSGIPRVCPAEKSGLVTIHLDAPSAPGLYNIYYCTAQDYNCKPALYKAVTLVGSVTVQEVQQQKQTPPAQSCSPDVKLSLNGAGNKIAVAPGADVTMNYDFSLSAAARCSNCKYQVMAGLNSQYLDCIYNSTPTKCPGKSSGTITKTIKAPTVPGTYDVFYSITQDYFCNPKMYQPVYFIGSIKVLEN
jgi:hypothetical protein